MLDPRVREDDTWGIDAYLPSIVRTISSALVSPWVPFSGVLAAAEDDDAVGPFEKVAQIAVDEDDALAGEFSATGSAK
jgi:hypothetical protein